MRTATFQRFPFVTALVIATFTTGFGLTDPRRSKLYLKHGSQNMFCDGEENAEITLAYYDQDSRGGEVCDKDCNATDKADSPSQCFVAPAFSVPCVQRLNLSDLRLVYSTCDASPSLCELSDIRDLSVNGVFQVEYICVPESQTFNPCHPILVKDVNSPLLLLKGGTPCTSVCEISALYARSLHFKYRFLQQGSLSEAADENAVHYRFVFTDEGDNPPEWSRLQTSYDTHYPGFVNATKLQLRFGIRNPENLIRLWIFLTGLTVRIECSNNSKLPVDNSTTADSMVPVIAGVGAAVFVTIVIVGVITLQMKRRRHTEHPHKTEPKGDNTEVPLVNVPMISAPLPDSGAYEECFPGTDQQDTSVRGQKPEAVMSTQSGCDVAGDEYGHLQHGSSVLVAPSGGGVTYDHVLVGRADDLYNALQRQPRRQKIVDNVYSSTSSS
ncbi:hypothetical protein BaRGS_00020969 [Batillaria attramentaria]|uniref:Uncharacterized protein n=1 Tax=Batillaria attramentaria TaxID=370345 RepID=A0ABD0KKZ0_9CAEN